MPEFSIEEWGAIVVAVASVVAASVAVIALIVAKQQIATTNDISVQDAYLEYHRLCIQHPEFANPDYTDIAKDEVMHERYYWFVLSMLICVERVLQTYRDTASWENAIQDDFELHQDFICGDRFAPVIQNFDEPLRSRLLKFRIEQAALAKAATEAAAQMQSTAQTEAA